jgi:hypothetical protein
MRWLFPVLFFVISDIKCQENKGLVMRMDFTGGKPVNVVNGKSANASHVLYVSDRFGNRESALFVHGSPGSYLSLGTDKAIKPENGTISIWAKVEVETWAGRGYQFNPIILAKNGILNKEGKNDDFYEAYGIAYDFRTHRITVSTTLSEERQINAHSRDTVTPQKWYHLVLTYDSTQVSLYVNGVLQARLPKNFKSLFSATDSVILGYSNNLKNERYFCGALDDLRIYNRVLSPEEVRLLYNLPDPNKWHRIALWLLWAVSGLAVVFLLAWVVSWRVRKNLARQKETVLNNAKLNDLETKAIRSHMNPHFIFNALCTLQRFILEGDLKKANSYLVKFSKLLRELLESGTSESISVKDEVDLLRGYVEIEKLRFDKTFDFGLHVNVPAANEKKIPFMLIQPFVENAIWHGLLPKHGKRKLDITISEESLQTLLCVVEDNGVGRSTDAWKSLPMKKKSVGMEFVKQRLEILRKVTNTCCSFKIDDKIDADGKAAGTKVSILIPILD